MMIHIFLAAIYVCGLVASAVPMWSDPRCENVTVIRKVVFPIAWPIPAAVAVGSHLTLGESLVKPFCPPLEGT